jgi:hypothetical protein
LRLISFYVIKTVPHTAESTLSTKWTPVTSKNDHAVHHQGPSESKAALEYSKDLNTKGGPPGKKPLAKLGWGPTPLPTMGPASAWLPGGQTKASYGRVPKPLRLSCSTLGPSCKAVTGEETLDSHTIILQNSDFSQEAILGPQAQQELTSSESPGPVC